MGGTESGVYTPADGAAIAVFDLARLLYARGSYESARIYNGLVRLLDPVSPFARMMEGDIALLTGQPLKAVASYDAVNSASPIFWLARLRSAEAYEAAGDAKKTVEVLSQLAKNDHLRPTALAFLGDVYRRQNKLSDAVESYNAALEGGAQGGARWQVVYARAIARSDLNDWAGAEKDAMAALAMQPENPMILNFIAYGWADRGVNLDKALEYAERAVGMKPDDGYVVDSYGWVLFRLGRYEESIRHLEKAVELSPGDSAILDHLGDAYWQAGRQNEARSRWRQADDLSRDTSFKTLVRQKVRDGISPPALASGKEARL